MAEDKNGNYLCFTYNLQLGDFVFYIPLVT